MQIANDVIEFIKDRSVSGVGFNPVTGRNKTYVPYTKQYAEFKGQSDVDLIYSGDMFSAIKILDQKDGKVTIGFDAGSDENGKAEGNQIGSYGKPKGDPSKARPFLGIQKNDLKEIVENVLTEEQTDVTEEKEQGRPTGTDLDVIAAIRRYLRG